MFPLAIGELGLTVDAFDAMTPRELQWAYEGAQRRETRAMDRLAQLAAWVLQPWLTKPITADDLMGRPVRTNWRAWIAE